MIPKGNESGAYTSETKQLTKATRQRKVRKTKQPTKVNKSDERLNN